MFIIESMIVSRAPGGQSGQRASWVGRSGAGALARIIAASRSAAARADLSSARQRRLRERSAQRLAAADVVTVCGALVHEPDIVRVGGLGRRADCRVAAIARRRHFAAWRRSSRTIRQSAEAGHAAHPGTGALPGRPAASPGCFSFASRRAPSSFTVSCSGRRSVACAPAAAGVSTDRQAADDQRQANHGDDRTGDTPREMSEDNVELVHKAVDATNKRDLATLDAIFSEEGEFHSTFAASEGRVFRGRDGVRDYFATLSEVFDDMRIEIEEIADAGADRLVVVVRVMGRGKGSGAEVEQRNGQVWAFGNGRITRIDSYSEPGRRLRGRSAATVVGRGGFEPPTCRRISGRPSSTSRRARSRRIR